VYLKSAQLIGNRGALKRPIRKNIGCRTPQCLSYTNIQIGNFLARVRGIKNYNKSYVFYVYDTLSIF